MLKTKNIQKRLLALVLAFTMIASNLMFVSAEETQKNVNLALDKTVTASAAYSTLPASNLTDSDKESRWSTEQNATQWAYVDLGSTMEMNYFSIIWESSSVYGAAYNIYVSDDTNDWGTAVVSKTGNTDATSVENLETPVAGRYVKLEVTEVEGYPSVSARDFTIMYKDASAQDPNQNIALNQPATASSIEAESVRAGLAVDGDTSSRTSRWGSNVGDGPHWIYVDFGEVKDVRTVKVFWENRKATEYAIQTAETLSDSMAESDWTTQKTFNARPATKNQTITLDETVKARYVRLLISDFTAAGPDAGDVEWNSISIFEMEVYGGIPVSTVDPLEMISVDTPEKGAEKLTVNIPEVEGYEIAYNGTDYEHVVDRDLTIYQPIVDTEVSVSFKITETATGKFEFKEIPVTIPGQYEAEEGDNAAPTVIPELREWKGATGVFTATDAARIVVSNEFAEMAEKFAIDYTEITGKSIDVVIDGEPKAGDYYFVKTADASLGLKKEGYLMEISDMITVTAEDATGAFWATRTILQSFKANDNTIEKGITRDYPLYEVRGFILDVGRKTFTMDYLEQMVDLMSWYKLNDFQIHLNDNLIPLENYSKNGEDPMTAYSGFRLESDIKKGGNNGLNKADLTSTDVFYTKDDFRSLIQDARVCGVNIVPEIDTPAHSLALTKVRPDLKHGTYGRDNDHLNLTSKYDESLEFVQSIFGEYMDDENGNPVFDKDTIVHVGADEYSADGDAFRRFCNDMFDYVQGKDRTTRVWGSLTSIKGTGAVEVRGDKADDGSRVQMNLWNYGWANIDEMYKLGFDLINCNDGNYYIVPNAGYYYDYLNDGTLYNLAINTIGGYTVPAGDEQMIGGAIAVWNDMTDYLENGISEYDVYRRVREALPLFGAKLWGKQDMNLDEAKSVIAEMGDGPGTNFEYEVPMDEDGVIANLDAYDMADLGGVNTNTQTEDCFIATKLAGGESWSDTTIGTVGLGNNLRVKVKRTTDSKEEQILFESAYGNIQAVNAETGKVAIYRENRDYVFDYELPVNEWVELEFKNEFERVSLYVNGKLVDTLGDGEKVEGQRLLATCMLPIEYVGSKTNAFEGYIMEVSVGKDADYVSEMPLVYAMITASQVAEDSIELVAALETAQAVLEKYAATEKEVADATAALETIIEKTPYEKADYSRVDAYLEIALGDLSAFTEESVARLNRVIDSIRKDLPEEQQVIVDGYETQLASALAQLEIESKANVNYVENATLSASASSHQDNGSAPDKAIDGDETTIWHSKWSVVTMPHWIQLSFKGEPEAVNGITYVPRQSGANGNVTRYVISGSNDGVNFDTIKEGTLSSDSSTKEITFDKVTYKHIRITYVEAVNNNGSAAELKLHKAEVSADKEGLKAILDEVKALENIGYTEASWDELQAVIVEAEALYNEENPDAEAVENIKRNLSAAKVALVLEEKDVDEPTPVVNPFEDVKEEDYYYNPVLWAVEKGITTGTSATTFSPDDTCTRGAVVTFLWRAAGCPEPEAAETAFVDVATSDYYYKAVLWAVEQGITTGTSATTFDPNAGCTRGQVVTFLFRASKEEAPAEAENAFTDVVKDAYYEDAVLWAVEKGITTGTSATTFEPDTDCTRGQIVTFIYRSEK